MNFIRFMILGLFITTFAIVLLVLLKFIYSEKATVDLFYVNVSKLKNEFVKSWFLP